MEIKHADVGIRNRTSIWLSGIMGFAVGDALGAPVEFGKRWMRDMDLYEKVLMNASIHRTFCTNLLGSEQLQILEEIVYVIFY